MILFANNQFQETNLQTKQYSTESSPIKKPILNESNDNYAHICNRISFRKGKNSIKDSTSKSTSAIVVHPKIASFLVPELRDHSKYYKEEVITNEIESQCPQMMAFFEGSQAGTDENLSQIR